MKTKTYVNVDKIVEQDNLETQADLLEAIHILKLLDVEKSNLYAFDKNRVSQLLNKY